jgi:hypothetical protein
MKWKRVQSAVWLIIFLTSVALLSGGVIAGDEQPLQKCKATGIFCYPTTGSYMRGFSSSHKGVDIAGPAGVVPGNPVYAMYSGRVVYVGRADTGADINHAVAIDHGKIGDKYVLSFYVHMGHGSQGYAEVSVGDKVEKGTLIGYQGDAGIATGVHLHFEVHEKNGPYRSEYTSWGRKCQGDLWYEFGRADYCDPHPDPAVYVNPESSTYIGSLPSSVTENCSNLDDTPPAISFATPTQDRWYNSDRTLYWSITDDDSGVDYFKWEWNDSSPDTRVDSDIGSTKLSVAGQGRHTLYLQAWDNEGNATLINRQGWFGYDTVAPSNPTSVDPGCTATSNVWQNTCSDTFFTWSGASDSTSGVDGYQLYWGDDPNGTWEYWVDSANFNPDPVDDGTYYFRTRTSDIAGNWSNWATLFVLRYNSEHRFVYLPLMMQAYSSVSVPVTSAQIRVRFFGRTTTNTDSSGHDVLSQVVIRDPMSGQVRYEAIDLLPVSSTTPEKDYGTITLASLDGLNIYTGKQYEILVTGKMHLTRKWSVNFSAAQSTLDFTDVNDILWAGDFNDDNRVDEEDYQIFTDEYMKSRQGTITPEMSYKIDLNGDDAIDMEDYSVFVDSYSNGPGIGDE